MCLSTNIKYLRKKFEYSQDKLAEVLGYKSYTTIQKWESGVSEPPVKIVRRIAEIFNVDMNELTSLNMQKRYENAVSDFTDNNDKKDSEYYLNEDARDMAQFLYDNPDYKVLFDASRKVKAEDINFVKQMLDKFKSE